MNKLNNGGSDKAPSASAVSRIGSATLVAAALTIGGCGGGESASGTPDVVVTPPDVVVTPPGTAKFDKSLVVGTTGTQLDLTTLVGSSKVTDLVGLPTGVTWDYKTNILTVPATVIGNVANNPYRITFTATDATGRKTIVTLNTDINNAPTANTPVVPVTTLIDTPVTISNVSSYFTDKNGDALTIKSAESAEGSVTIAGNAATFVPKSAYIGDAVVKIMVGDGREGYATRDFSTLVKAAAVARFNLNVGSITESTANIACSVFATYGANATCILRRAEDGFEMMRWSAGDNVIARDLMPNTGYAVYLEGTIKSATGVNEAFPTKVEGFRTNAGGIVCPPGTSPLPDGTCA